MTLDAWLTANNLTSQEFARRIGVTGEAVRKWRCGERVPRHDAIRVIRAETRGRVTPNDFFSSPDELA